MTARQSFVLASACVVAASPAAVWRTLTVPDPMRRWMLVPGHVLPNRRLGQGSRIEWRDSNDQPYLLGTVSDCLAERRLTVDLQDRSWPRPARPGEVTWSFDLFPVDGGTRVHYRLGDLAIDPEAEDLFRAYAEADEVARLARVAEEDAA